MSTTTAPTIPQDPSNGSAMRAETKPSTGAVTAPVPTPTKRRSPFVVLGAIGVVTLLGIGGFLLSRAGVESTDDAQVEADVVPIAARVGGTVRAVRVRDNQKVKAGDVLVEVDDAEYSVRVAEAEAALATAKAEWAAAQSQEEVTEAAARGNLHSAKAVLSSSSVAVGGAAAQVDAARASLARAEVEAKQASSDLARSVSLHGTGALSDQGFERARAANEAAQAAAAAARAQLSGAEENKRLAETRVSEAQGHVSETTPVDARIAAAKASADLAAARVKSAEARLELARLELSYTKVVAPIEGTVSKLSANVGQLFAAGQPFAELVPNETYVVANFKETQVGRIRPGQNVEIDVDAYPGHTLSGVVRSLSGGTGARFSLLPPDNASGNFVKVVQRVPVRIDWKQLPADVSMRAGFSTNVTVHVN